ncbi:MAG: DUF3604 domain-containing protein [Hyphomicrobiales bacterium]|nr:DUF3604 domain-containing protein [Hyphomicrobiales bacterium]
MISPASLKTILSSLAVGLTATAFAGIALAEDTDDESVAGREAAVPNNPLKDAYFGEQHVHTSYSLDAFIGGNRLTPDDAYRFAKGSPVTVAGRPHSIGRPLDFVAVTDHAEFLGEMYSTQVEDAEGHNDPKLVELRSLTDFEDQEAWFTEYVVANNRSGSPQHTDFYYGDGVLHSGWQVLIDAARRHYEPGTFTTIPAFEWSAAPNGGNMHRNVHFRDMNLPDLPFSNIDSSDEEKLWDWLATQKANGSTVLAIPHNSNASKGQMFEAVDNAGNPIDADYARTRVKWEPLIEMMQIKGNSEVVASLWPADEYADFENAPSISNYSDRTFDKNDFVRWAVTKGLDYQRKLGVNPYKLGFMGGTDSHNSLPGDVAEGNYVGSHGGADGSVERRRDADIAGWIMGKDSNPGSISGVWATKNTRGAIWDAMNARETFATSGPRIKVRFFGGADLTADPIDAVALVEGGYAKGVPMGGTLEGIDGRPTFVVQAMMDPIGANLDRIQIIKGWVDDAGEPQEKIIDVVWSDDRQPDDEGKLPPVGNTVDLETAYYTNDIGAPQLIGSWTDDDFDQDAPALYYARVLEIPTPRWSTYDAVRNNMPLLDGVPATIQERAWTSPIWYTPAG